MHVVPAVKCEGKPRNEFEFLHLWTSSKLVLKGSMQRNLLVVMERLCDISVLIGTQDQSADICQTYLDQPLTFANDALDLFVPNIGPDVLDDIIRKIKECNTDELSDPSVILYVKQICAGALSTVNNSTDADAVAGAARLLLLLFSLPGASAYGIYNTSILMVVANYVGKLSTIALKNPVKRLTQKEKENINGKIRFGKEKKDKKKKKKNDSLDEEIDECGGSGESDEEICVDRDMTLSQLSQDSQIFGAAELEAVEIAPRGRVLGQVSYLSMKKLFSEFKNALNLYTERHDDIATDSCVDALISLLFLSASQTEFSGLNGDILSALSFMGSSSESALLMIYRSLMPSLSTAGRDQRLPEGSKVRAVCHKASVQVVLALIKMTPKIPWGKSVDRGGSGSTPEDLNQFEDASCDNEDEMDVSASSPVMESVQNSSHKRKSIGSTGNKKERENEEDKLSTPYICVVAALQRMTLTVPDKATSRSLILCSIILILSSLHENKADMNVNNKGDRYNVPQGFCPLARLAAVKYLTFLQILSKSNKIGFRAFSLDIITECMGEEWLWSIPPKITDLSSSSTNSNCVVESGNFYARSLLSKVLQRCSDVAPTVRIRALGAIQGLLVKLQDKAHENPIGMCSSLLDLALGYLESNEENIHENINGNENENGLGLQFDSVNEIFKSGNEDICDESTEYRDSKNTDGVECTTPLHNNDDTSAHTNKKNNHRKCLFDVLHLRMDDEKPMVRAKAIQTFGTALCVAYPQQNICPISYQDVAGHDGSHDRGDDHAVVYMPISSDDVSVLFELCSDASLSTRKQALASLSELLSSRSANTMLQDAWVTSCLCLVSDPESSIQQKAAQCTYDLIVHPSVTWAKWCSGSSPRVDVSMDLVWHLCCKISETGRCKFLSSAVSIMLKQGIIKPNSTGGSDRDGGKGSMAAVMLAVKTACCHDTPLISRGGWVLLEALTTGDESAPVLPTHSSPSPPLKDADKERGKDIEEDRREMSLDAVPMLESSNFIFDSFLRRHERDMTKGSPANEQRVIVLDEDDERILKVLKKNTDSLSHANLSKTRNLLISVLIRLQCTPSTCSISLATLFEISKSIAKITSREYQNIGDEERVQLLLKLWYSDVQKWTADLLLSVYRAAHTAVWGEELDESLLYELFCTDSSREIVRSDNMKLPNLTKIQRVSLLNTFTSPPAEGNSNSFENSFWNEKKDLFNQTQNESQIENERRESEHSKSVGIGMLSSGIFLLGEISMLGFSVEEDEGLSTTIKKNNSTKLPSYTISEVSKSFKIIVPKNLVLLNQTLMSTYLPNLAAKSDLSHVSNYSYNSQTSNGAENGRVCTSVIRAHAFVTMGKFCLRDKSLARININVFLRELHVQKDPLALSSNPSVRSNALFILGDLCVRYTNLVDRHIGVLAACLQDVCVLVRKHALILLTQLLLQDFIKWRGLLLFRFLATATDKDEEMAEFAKSVLKKTLNVKYPDFFALHFSECILVLNDCTDHPVFLAVSSSGAEGGSCPVDMQGVDLFGQKKRTQRLRLYGFMMSDFTDEQKIQVTAKIVQDLLSYAVDYLGGNTSGGGIGSASSPSLSLSPSRHTAFEESLRDAFLVLQSPLLKVGRKSNSLSENENDIENLNEEDPGSAANNVGKALEKAKNKVLKKLSIQHLLLHMLPVVHSLKHVLETNNSHLQRPLMDYLVTFVKAQKTEAFQAMSADPCMSDLKAEIEYEIKLYDKNVKEKNARSRLGIENFDLNWEEKTVEKVVPDDVISPNLDPSSWKSLSPPKNSTNKKRSTPLKTVKYDSTNGNENGNEMNTVSMSLEKKTISSNKNMLFLSPLKSSIKNNGLRFIPFNDEEESEEKEKAGDDQENKEKKNRVGGYEEEKEGDGQRDSTSPMRKSKRRSWGVVVSNLNDTEEISQKVPMSKKTAKKITADTKLRVARSIKNALDDEADNSIEELEMRFTPLKKRSQINKL